MARLSLLIVGLICFAALLTQRDLAIAMAGLILAAWSLGYALNWRGMQHSFRPRFAPPETYRLVGFGGALIGLAWFVVSIVAFAR